MEACVSSLAAREISASFGAGRLAVASISEASGVAASSACVTLMGCH